MSGLDLQDQLRCYGAPMQSVVPLDVEPSPAQVPYLDLCEMPGRSSRSPVVDAIVELDHHAVAYVARGALTGQPLDRLTGLLAQRGEADHLVMLEPGQLHVVPLGVSRRPSAPHERVELDSAKAATTIPRLGLGQGRTHLSKRLHSDLLKLLTTTIDEIVDDVELDIERDEALSWVSRAVFFRFLIDRGIVKSCHLPEISGADSLACCFQDAECAVATSAWLKDVFNGDLLPVADGRRSLRAAQWKRLCWSLSLILHKAEPSGQLRFSWATLDFGHLPVGVLSQVYENYSHRYEGHRAKRDSIHYTPRSLAEYMVAEALFQHPKGSAAKVLDPACGGGVFLVASLRELVRARWRETGRRPTRRAIRAILNEQLAGFDTNETALRFASLSLYLTALELDPRPAPLNDLGFDKLLGTVLHDVARPDRPHARVLPPLGSLGRHVSKSHSGVYDIVVGNPPWTKWSVPKGASKAQRAALDKQRAEVEGVVNKIKRARTTDLATLEPFTMVDNVPDLPMSWRALDWLRPGGRLALLVSARLLFKQTEPGVKSRAALFGSMRLTGVLNASQMRDTKLWPGIRAQVCILFADNLRPKSGDAFMYVSPYMEKDLNDRGIMRVDPSDARSVSHREVVEDPTLLKTLFRGTELDLAVHRKLRRWPTLETYWVDLELMKKRGWELGPDPRNDATHLHHLPELSAASRPSDSFRIDVTTLRRFGYPRVRRGDKTTERYSGPLVLLPQSPPVPKPPKDCDDDEVARRRAYFCVDDIAFNESYFGFSAHGHPDATGLAQYLFLVLASELVVYVALLTSNKFGVERDTYLLEDILRLPVRPFENLSGEERSEAAALAKRTLRSEPGELDAVTESINAFVYRCHGLGRRDAQVIQDTLAVATPFATARDNAQRRPTDDEVRTFADALQRGLETFLRRRGATVDARVLSSLSAPDSPWVFLELGREHSPDTRALREITQGVIDMADEHGASLAMYRYEAAETLVVAVLARYRHFTTTRARLLVSDILREYEDYLVEVSR